MHAHSKNKTRLVIAVPLLMGALSVLSGCQIDVSGQTLPSPYYLTDDVQFFAPAPSEFKLSREAAAQKEQREAYESGRQPCCPDCQ